MAHVRRKFVETFVGGLTFRVNQSRYVFFIILKLFLDKFSVDVGYGFLFTINIFNFILIVSARDISSFLRDVDGAYSLSCVEVFLFRSTIVGVDLDLFDKRLEFIMVAYS